MSDTQTNQTSQPVPDTTSGASLADMGIGSAEQGVDITRHDPVYTQEQKDEAFKAELAKLTEGGEDVDAVEGASQWGKDGEFKPVTDPPAAEPEPEKDGLPFDVPEAYNEPDPGQPGQQLIVEPATGFKSPDIDLNAIAESVYGAVPDEATARALLQMARDMQQMSPVQIAQMQQILQGQEPYYPQQYPQQPQPQQPQPNPYQPTPQPFTPQQPIQPPDWSQYQIPDELDPDVAQTIQPLTAALQYQQQQLEQMQHQQQQMNMARMEQEQRQIQTQAVEAVNTWRQQKQSEQLINDTEWILLEQAATESGLAPYFQNQYGDTQKAIYATLDYVFNADPKFQERVVAKRTMEERQRAAEQAKRTNASTALAGGGGARTAATNGNQQTIQGAPKQTGNPADNMAGLIDGIAEWMAGN